MCVPLYFTNHKPIYPRTKPLTSEKFKRVPNPPLFIPCVHSHVIMFHFLFAQSCLSALRTTGVKSSHFACSLVSLLFLRPSCLALLLYFSISPFLQPPFSHLENSHISPAVIFYKTIKHPTSSCPPHSPDNTNIKPICKCVRL